MSNANRGKKTKRGQKDAEGKAAGAEGGMPKQSSLFEQLMGTPRMAGGTFADSGMKSPSIFISLFSQTATAPARSAAAKHEHKL